MKVYLAGKISSNDWRFDIVSGLLDESRINESNIDRTWPILENSIFKTFSYCGPYFTAFHPLARGPSHGDTLHGNGLENDKTHYNSSNRDHVVSNCFKSIASCDIFFLWINSLDCYGSLVELGYAKALNKTIRIGVEKGLDISELWFAQFCNSFGGEQGEHIDFENDNPKDSLYRLVRKLQDCESPRVARILASLHKTDYGKEINESNSTTINPRTGQSKYKSELLKYWEGKCSVTGCAFEDVLRASHIKPFCVSNTDEEYDLYNGFLLIPNLDILFDRGFISFDKQGKIIISKEPDEVTLKTLGVTSSMKLRKITDQHNVYLDYHLNHVFKP